MLGVLADGVGRSRVWFAAMSAVLDEVSIARNLKFSRIQGWPLTRER